MLILAFCRFNNHELDILIQSFVKKLINGVALAGTGTAGNKSMRCKRTLRQSNIGFFNMIHMKNFTDVKLGFYGWCRVVRNDVSAEFGALNNRKPGNGLSGEVKGVCQFFARKTGCCGYNWRIYIESRVLLRNAGI